MELEKFQRKAEGRKWSLVIDQLLCEELLHKPMCFSLEKRRLIENTTESCKIISDVERVDGIQQFTASSHTRTTSEATRSQLNKKIRRKLVAPHIWSSGSAKLLKR